MTSVVRVMLVEAEERACSVCRQYLGPKSFFLADSSVCCTCNTIQVGQPFTLVYGDAGGFKHLPLGSVPFDFGKHQWPRDTGGWMDKTAQVFGSGAFRGNADSVEKRFFFLKKRKMCIWCVGRQLMSRSCARSFVRPQARTSSMLRFGIETLRRRIWLLVMILAPQVWHVKRFANTNNAFLENEAVLVEPFLGKDYMRFTSNSGWVADDLSELLRAFSHFSFH